MTRPKSSHAQCVEACSDRYPQAADTVGFDKCCDKCDETYAAGKESTSLGDLMAERDALIAAMDGDE
jgi:hypothetical protein